MTLDIERDIARSWTETPPLAPPLRHVSGTWVERQSWLDALAAPLQGWVKNLFRAPGAVKVKNILHGTWFGHPVHPAIVTIPLGSWGATWLLDSLWKSDEDFGMARAADATLCLGVVGAVAAALTGVTDWSETDATDRRVGLGHGLLNAVALLGNLTSLGMRATGNRRAGITLNRLSYVVSLCAAYLGGELSYAKGIGVNHVAWEGGPDNFVPVIRLADLPERELTRVDASGMPAVLWREGGNIFALAATCSHMGGPLDEGTCQDGLVSCPWHGSTFRVDNGAVVIGPAVYAQPTFAVRVRNDQVELRRLEHA